MPFSKIKFYKIKKILVCLLAGLFLLPASPLLSAPEHPGDQHLLDEIQKTAVRYFLEESNPANGLVRDHAHNFQKGARKAPASIAATGFALTAYPIAIERGWLDYSEGFERTRRTLEFFARRAQHKNGFFYHYLNMETGQRANKSEASAIDTALLVAGAIFAADYFDHALLKQLAAEIYERVDFKWMLNGGKTFALAWMPEDGFDRRRWDHYDEAMILYLLALGSPAHPVSKESWDAVQRPVGSYRGHRVIQMPPLFTHQYSHIWIDFRDKNDGFADYFENSVQATLANRAFCHDQAAQFKSYGKDSWGLTASDGPFGYRAYGAPPGWAVHDGTVAPTACGGSIVFTPEESLSCLRFFYETLKDKLWGTYGFSDAFNLDKNWFSEVVIGIDQGAMLAMIENYRSELIWKVMNKNPFIQAGMKSAGFIPGTKELPWPDPPVYKVPYQTTVSIDGFLRDWSNPDKITLNAETARETGHIDDDRDLQLDAGFAWNQDGLYFYAKVSDSDLVARKTGKNIWMDDLVELYVDPEGDGLYWENEEDYQIGFRPALNGEVLIWAWFQEGLDPPASDFMKARSYVDEQGYILEGFVGWEYLKIEPSAGMKIKFSVAVHDIDGDRSEGKLQWFFRNEEAYRRYTLGTLILESKNDSETQTA